MKITSVKLVNVRCFKDEKIDLSPGINILVGNNNSGKSTIINALRLLQYGEALSTRDIRLGSDSGNITIGMSPDYTKYFSGASGEFLFELEAPQGKFRGKEGNIRGINLIPAQEPGNYIYPYLSKRKVITYSEEVNEANTNKVTGDFQFLYSKVARISNRELPSHEQYVKACDEILGFRIFTSQTPGGSKATYAVGNYDSIPLDAMGEGVANILGLIVDLCLSEENLFLLEEPENDIHPYALKALLQLIIEKASSNQFVITTHSNIVTKYLGAGNESKIFNILTDYENKIPTSKVFEVTTIEERRDALEMLGYELWDFDLYDYWLILEESSAETIVRDHLMRWFVPSLLNKLRTVATGGVQKIRSGFELFVYLHLQPAYKNKAWVIIDGGPDEKEIIDELIKTYVPSGWDEGHFLQFTQHNFEKYYPESFQDRVQEILTVRSKTEKRQKKKTLLDDVVRWIKEDDDVARAAFEISAEEVINALHIIEDQVIK